MLKEEVPDSHRHPRLRPWNWDTEQHQGKQQRGRSHVTRAMIRTLPGACVSVCAVPILQH